MVITSWPPASNRNYTHGVICIKVSPKGQTSLDTHSLADQWEGSASGGVGSRDSWLPAPLGPEALLHSSHLSFLIDFFIVVVVAGVVVVVVVGDT